jgi:hypothetical protein
MFVLRRVEDGKYVAVVSHRVSDTFNFRFVRFFPSRESAERERCGNETVEPVG